MSIYPHKADAVAQVYESEGLNWVTHQDLLDAGYLALEDFSIVFLNNVFYELQGYAEKPNAWWIEEVDAP